MFGRQFWFRFGLFAGAFVIVSILAAVFVFQSVKASLPQIISVADYKPLLVSPVYDRNNKKIGEFARERRTLIPFEKIPKHVVDAFLAAEDDQFYQHNGINYMAILRAAVANIRAGHTVQGASTITQQLAKTLFLSTEQTLLRKVREALLSRQMEENLSKEEILYLYLNQIYFGQGAYGIENAAQTYFKKHAAELTVGEAAMLAGLPKAPSAYSPVRNPRRAKERQAYVLRRMAEVGSLEKALVEKSVQEPITVYVRENYEDIAPYYLETVRLMLVQLLGEKAVLDEGIRIQTSLDITKQKAANEALVAGLKDLDKRQGFRGPLKNIQSPEEMTQFLADNKKSLISEATPERTILPDGTFAEIQLEETADPASSLPVYMKVGQTVQGIVREVNDALKYTRVALPDAEGIIDFESMKWARKPDEKKRADQDQIKNPSAALKVGDVIMVKIAGEKAFVSAKPDSKPKKNEPPPPKPPDFSRLVALELDQEPISEASLISLDLQTQDVLSMVGGYDFKRNEYNRALQAARQTGSAFKAFVYAAALDRGYNPSSVLMDVPLVYEETVEAEGQTETNVWRPSNHGRSFGGEMTFRNALVQSLNVPTVKVIEDLGVPWAADYARRLGIFSPLNMDFTLALGSSSVTLYEMTKAFSHFGRLGKRIRPLIIRRVEDRHGTVLLQNVSLDLRFENEIKPIEEAFETRRKAWLERPTDQNPDQPVDPKKDKTDRHFFTQDESQLISPQTAYITTSLLKGVIEDPKGTGGRARALGREAAGKTGSTNGYYDAWFIGYTPQISTGVWVGFDKERSLGLSEVGGRSALPIWVDYMKAAHEGLPQMTFPVPDGIVFANIDRETGRLASASTKTILRQAFVEGTEPTEAAGATEDATDFYKQDLTE